MQDVRVPEHVVSTAPVERARLLAEPVDRVVLGHSPRHDERVVELQVSARVARLVAVILEDHRAVLAISVHREGLLRDAEAEARRLEDDLVGRVPDLERRRRRHLEARRERRALVEGTCLRDLQAQDVREEHVDAHLLLADAEEEAALRLLDPVDAAQRDVVRAVDRRSHHRVPLFARRLEAAPRLKRGLHVLLLGSEASQDTVLVKHHLLPSLPHCASRGIVRCRRVVVLGRGLSRWGTHPHDSIPQVERAVVEADGASHTRSVLRALSK